MGIHITLHSRQQFMLAIFHGSVNDHELDSFVDEMLLEQYNSDKSVRLTILSKGVSGSQLSYHTIYAAGKRMRQGKFRQKYGKIAIIANSAVSFGLARMYQLATVIAESSEVRVLHEDGFESATEWLGISDLSEDIQKILDSVTQSEEKGLSVQVI